MHRVRDVAARIVLAAVAFAASGLLPGCVSQLDKFRQDWASIKAKGAAPCADAEQCHALIARLDMLRKEACGDAPKCEETADLEAEIRPAVLLKFQAPCEQDDPQACFEANAFGFDDGLRAACDLGLAKACVSACEEGGGVRAAAICTPLVAELDTLLAKCRFRHDDRAEACKKLGRLIRTMSASAGTMPPRLPPNGPSLYATPILEGRGRCRYALDYLSRGCHLGDGEACGELCSRRADEEGQVDIEPCRRIVKESTAKSLQAACRKRNAVACNDLASLYSRMGFFDRDPAGFFITGPGRVVGLKALACELGATEACTDGAGAL